MTHNAIRRSSSHLLGLAAALMLASSLAPSLAFAQAPPTLGLSKTYFTVNGQAKFLTFFAYFAALRPTGSAWGATLTAPQRANHLAEVESHFQMLKGMGFDGVRIFPNWAWSFTVINGCDVPDPNTVMRASAGAPVASPIPGKPATTYLNTQQLELLHQVLLAAGRQQLIVEVAWNNEQVRTITPANNQVLDRLTALEYSAALSEVVTQFSGLHPHMYYDLHNEYNYGVGGGTPCPKEAYGAAAWGTLVPTLRGIDPTRKFTASFTTPPSLTLHQVAVNEAYTATFDLVSYHDPRDWSGTTPLWPGQTGTHVNGLRGWIETRAPSSQWKPVLFSEPERWLCCASPESSVTATHLRTAIANAKSTGAAGWTLHTQSVFKDATILGGNIPASVAPGFTLGGPEWDFMNSFNAHIAPVAWGIPRLAGYVDTPTAGATVHQSFPVSGWVLDRAAANAAATTVTLYRSNTPNVPQVLLGAATVASRPDVAAIYGAEYLNAGFTANLTLPVGPQYLVLAITDSVNGVPYFSSISLNVIP